jgi:hypothetical protein
VRPLFPFYGSKWNIARYYPKPRLGHVCEPFAGSAGYATFYEPARVTLLDADPVVVGVWDFLLRTSATEIRGLPDMPAVGDSTDNYALPQEAKWLIGFWLNRGSATPKKSRTAYSARTDKAQLVWGPRAKERIVSQLGMLAGWSVKLAPYDHAPDVEATWFVDPPYGDKGKFYRVPFQSYASLGEWTKARRGDVIVCEGTGANWLPFAPLGSFKSSKGRADEVVYVRAGAVT